MDQKAVLTVLFLILGFCSAMPQAQDGEDDRESRKLYGGQQSYFEGRIGNTDTTCETRTLKKGAPLPITMTYTNAKKITAYKIQANQYSKQGFTATASNTPALPTATVNVNIDGPPFLLYDVTTTFYCAP